jgi:hypothetical protein
MRQATGYDSRQLGAVLTYCKQHPGEPLPRVPQQPWPLDMTTDAWRRWFDGCLMTKINRTLPASRGRKDCSTWYWEQWRASRALNTPRLRIHWLPNDVKERFAQRLHDAREDT